MNTSVHPCILRYLLSACPWSSISISSLSFNSSTPLSSSFRDVPTPTITPPPKHCTPSYSTDVCPLVSARNGFSSSMSRVPGVVPGRTVHWMSFCSCWKRKWHCSPSDVYSEGGSMSIQCMFCTVSLVL